MFQESLGLNFTSHDAGIPSFRWGEKWYCSASVSPCRSGGLHRSPKLITTEASLFFCVLGKTVKLLPTMQSEYFFQFSCLSVIFFNTLYFSVVQILKMALQWIISSLGFVLLLALQCDCWQLKNCPLISLILFNEQIFINSTSFLFLKSINLIFNLFLCYDSITI